MLMCSDRTYIDGLAANARHRHARWWHRFGRSNASESYCEREPRFFQNVTQPCRISIVEMPLSVFRATVRLPIDGSEPLRNLDTCIKNQCATHSLRQGPSCSIGELNLRRAERGVANGSPPLFVQRRHPRVNRVGPLRFDTNVLKQHV